MRIVDGIDVERLALYLPEILTPEEMKEIGKLIYSYGSDTTILYYWEDDSIVPLEKEVFTLSTGTKVTRYDISWTHYLWDK